MMWVLLSVPLRCSCRFLCDLSLYFWCIKASEAYAELKKKVLIKQERQGLEGQLCSLLRIAGQDTLSTKVMGAQTKDEEHVQATHTYQSDFPGRRIP